MLAFTGLWNTLAPSNPTVFTFCHPHSNSLYLSQGNGCYSWLAMAVVVNSQVRNSTIRILKCYQQNGPEPTRISQGICLCTSILPTSLRAPRLLTSNLLFYDCIQALLCCFLLLGKQSFVWNFCLKTKVLATIIKYLCSRGNQRNDFYVTFQHYSLILSPQPSALDSLNIETETGNPDKEALVDVFTFVSSFRWITRCFYILWNDSLNLKIQIKVWTIYT